MAKLSFRKKSQDASTRRNRRLPLDAQKSTTFQYSSNRMGAERGFDRGAAERASVHASKVRNQLTRIPYAIGLFCLVLGIFYLTTVGTSPQLVINGDQQLIRDKEVYQKTAEQLLGSKLQYRSKLSLNGQELAGQFQDKFPELKTVDVSTPLLRHRPVIEMVVSAPAVVFVSGNSTYLLDARGIALFDLKKTDHKIDVSRLPILSDQTNFVAEVNKPALAEAQIKFIYEVARQLSAKRLEISTMELTSGGGELDVRLKDAAYKIKFSFHEDGRRSAGAFLAAKEQLDKGGTKPAEYIDVRIPTRAYIK